MMIGAGQSDLPANVYLFRNPHWTAFETSLRYILVEDARAAGISVREHLSAMIRNNRYPHKLATNYKAHAVLWAYYRDEVFAFIEQHKEKLKNDSMTSITNLYFISIIQRIAVHYGIDITKIRK